MFRIALICLFLLTSCSKNKEGDMAAPKAAKVKHEFKVDSVVMEDNYAWMRDKNWPVAVKDDMVLMHLNEENKYTEQFFKDQQENKENLFTEIKSRIKLTDQSAPVKKDDYYYYTRTEEVKSYPIYCRKLGSMDASEEIILDVNHLAEGKKFVSVADVSLSPDHNLMAFGIDYSGDEKYLVKVLDLTTKQYLNDNIQDVSGGSEIVWHNSINGFFYVPVNNDLRSDTVMFHEIGTSNNKDQKIAHEPDPLYQVTIAESASKEFMIVGIMGLSSSESHIVSLKDRDLKLRLVKARKLNVQYNIEHNGDFIYLLTNDTGPNFRLMRSELKDLEFDNWKEYIPLDSEKYLGSFGLTSDYLILNYKAAGLPLIKILHLKDGKAQAVTFPDEAFTARGYSTNFAENDLRIDYSSLIRPNTTYTFDFDNNKLSVLKATEVLGGYNPDDYAVKRLWADNNGVKVPISLFYKKSLFKQDGTNPLYLYGYGSYGISIPPRFSPVTISLANRGFVYAIAHVRGGDDLGYQWYQDAKFLNKKHTFEDFIACSEFLIKEKYTNAGNIAISGGSAGGLLVGAVANMKPELYKAVVAKVPFVDVLNTMLDATLPLTPGEYEEWGNPKQKEYFDYIRSYSPYDNVTKQNYPAIFATAGISDPRVGYWEAAKWVAKLRELKEDDNTLILKTNMDAGHQGATDRFEWLREYAEEYVFVLKVFGLKE